jgi:hypothetical protein
VRALLDTYEFPPECWCWNWRQSNDVIAIEEDDFSPLVAASTQGNSAHDQQHDSHGHAHDDVAR